MLTIGIISASVAPAQNIVNVRAQGSRAALNTYTASKVRSGTIGVLVSLRDKEFWQCSGGGHQQGRGHDSLHDELYDAVW